MTLNKFCPVAQGEYYNIKSLSESQPFFTIFLISFYIFSLPLHFCCISSTYCFFVIRTQHLPFCIHNFKSDVRGTWRVILVIEAFLSIGDLTPSETNLLLHKKNRTLGVVPLSCFLLFVCFYHCL